MDDDFDIARVDKGHFYEESGRKRERRQPGDKSADNVNDCAIPTDNFNGESKGTKVSDKAAGGPSVRCTFAYLDVDKTSDWTMTTPKNNSYVTRGMVTATFHRQDISAAYDLFKRMPALAQKDLDFAIMETECEIIIDEGKKVTESLFTLRTRVAAIKPNLCEELVACWSEVMGKRERHLGQILLQYAAYHANAPGDSNEPSGMLHLGYMNRLLIEVVKSFISIKSKNTRLIMSHVVFAMHEEMLGVLKQVRVDDEYRLRLRAICCNYLAVVYNNVDQFQKSLKQSLLGNQLLRRRSRHSNKDLSLAGDLFSSSAVACMNLGDCERAERFQEKANFLFHQYEESKGKSDADTPLHMLEGMVVPEIMT